MSGSNQPQQQAKETQQAAAPELTTGAETPVTQNVAKRIYRKDYKPPIHLVTTTDLTIELGKQETKVRSVLTMKRNPELLDEETATAPIVFNCQGQPVLEKQEDGTEKAVLQPASIDSIKINGVELAPGEYELNNETLTILAPELHAAGADEFQVEIVSRNHPERNLSASGLYISGGLLTTQMESEGFRNFIPFPDRPDVLSTFRAKLIGDPREFPVMLCNGNEVATEYMPDGRVAVTYEDPFPKPSYLFALVAGDLVLQERRYTTGDGREINLHMWVEPGNEHRCDFALDSLERVLRWDERDFDRFYDLDTQRIVAVDTFNFGAMENKSLMIFNSSRVLADPLSTTDAEYFSVEGVVGHEQGHNWRGNRVTVRSWHEICLKEGLTRFTDQLFSEAHNPPELVRLDQVNTLRARQFPEDAGPNAHSVLPEYYVSPENSYTATTYAKGAELNRMLRSLVGVDAYRRGLNRYFECWDGQACVMEDLIDCVVLESDQDLSQYQLWYIQAGTPTVSVKMNHDLDSGELVLRFAQSMPDTPGQPGSEKEPLLIPIELGLLDKETGEEIPLEQILDIGGVRKLGKSFVFEMTEATQELRLKVDRAVVPSFLRGFSAPVIVDFEYSKEDLQLLASHDPDWFNNYEAINRLGKSAVFEIAKTLKDSDVVDLDGNAYLEALTAVLDRVEAGTVDRSFAARLLSLPGNDELLFQLNPDELTIDGLLEAKKLLQEAIAIRFQDRFAAIYSELKEDLDRPYEYNPEDVGKRALKNLSLRYLVYAMPETYAGLAADQVYNSNNMTDQYSGLVALCMVDSPQRGPAVEHFYTQWKSDKRVIAKWFTAQSALTPIRTQKDESKHEELPADIARSLSLRGAFDVNIPNHARAVFAAFTANLARFHHPSGDGYRYFADKIIETAQKNPMLAGLLTKEFGTHFQRLDLERRKLITAELSRILETPELPKQVIDAASRTLAVTAG